MFFLGNFFCFVRLLGLRGQAGGREGRRDGTRMNSLTFWTDLVPFPIFLRKTYVTLRKVYATLVFLGKRQFSLHFGRISCHFPRFLTKTYVTLVAVVVVVVTVIVLCYDSSCGCC